ncbi:MAG: hypothetical protein ACLU9S_08000 [Oscillospiraceae bacterium]
MLNKKLLSLALAATMGLSLVACGSQPSSSVSENVQTGGSSGDRRDIDHGLLGQ